MNNKTVKDIVFIIGYVAIIVALYIGLTSHMKTEVEVRSLRNENAWLRTMIEGSE